MIHAAIRVRHLYLSPGHNYFGHHGKEPSRHEIHEVVELHCLAGRGIEGDRFLDYKPDYKGQITFFAWEVCEQIRAQFGSGFAPSVFRRNAITEGVDLPALVGREFEIQGVRFAGTQHCAPCYWMDRAIAPGAHQALEGRGGLRAKILTSGVLRADRES